MSYKALYRQWRPQRFDDVVGQEHITKTLRNALKTGKVAHAYLLCGPRGTGKTSTAKIIAKTVNCEQPQEGEPCNSCHSCELINSGKSMDVSEIDGASNRGIDEIRDLREKVGLTPAEGRYKVYIIDEVHMLTGEAFNALLKTLEEPPAHVIFIMATTEPHKIPSTVLSRCQRFDFKRLSIDKMVSRMEKICDSLNIEYEKDALFTIARFAGGGMRDALSILDQCLSYCTDTLTLKDVEQSIGIVDYNFLGEFTENILAKNTSELIKKIDRIVSSGKDIVQFTSQLLDYLRNLLLAKVCNTKELLQVPEAEIDNLIRRSKLVSKAQLTEIIDILLQYEKEMRWSTDSRLLLEISVVKAVNRAENDLEKLIERINRLEKIINEGENLPEVKEKQIEKNNEEIREEVKEIRRNKNLDIEIIKSNWNDFLNVVKKKKIITYAFLVEAKPLEYSDGTLILGFEEQHVFHKDKLQQRDNKEAVETIFQEFFNQSITVKIEIINKKKESLQENGTESYSNDEGEKIVEEAIKLFGGNVVEIID